MVCLLLAKHKVEVEISQHTPEVEQFLPDVEVSKVVKVLSPMTERRECQRFPELDTFRKQHEKKITLSIIREQIVGQISESFY